jgi:DNA-binding winged helix-turn-helix (wHTH) protein
VSKKIRCFSEGLYVHESIEPNGQKMNPMDRHSPFTLEDWIVEPEFNQLTRNGVSHRIEPKMMGVLLHLAAQAQRVVSKDDTLQAVWPGTYVGEDVLPRCISHLRRILEDDRQNSHFIKTIPKIGYCLMVEPRPVEMSSATEAEPPAVSQEAPYTPLAPPSPIIHLPLPESSASPRLRYGRPGIALSVIAGLALAVGLMLWTMHIRRTAAVPAIQTFQITTNDGEQSNPAFSPDGKRVAFVWIKENDTQGHIYIKELGSESVFRLTNLADNESNPVWSADGKQIAPCCVVVDMLFRTDSLASL